VKTSTTRARSAIARRVALAASVGAAVVGSLAVGSSAVAFQPVQPVPSDSAADPARQGLAAFLAAQHGSGSSLEFDICPVLAESDLMAAAGAFGPVGTFADRSFAIDDDDGEAALGVTCELTRVEAPLGAVTAVGMGVWDFASLPEVTDWISSLPVTEGDHSEGGAMHGHCQEVGDDVECYQFWMLDGLVVGNYVAFAQYDSVERPDSPKEPLPVVAQILTAQLPVVLSTTAALAGSPPVS